MPLVAWSNDLSVGIASIDTQHRKLLDLINSLHEAMRQGQGRARIGEVARELSGYVSTHFTYEERLLRAHKWPELESHLATHKTYVAKVQEMQAQAANPTSSLVLEAQDFLRDWLTNHIRNTDTRYGSFLRSKGVT